jgi:hypothetical protein
MGHKNYENALASFSIARIERKRSKNSQISTLHFFVCSQKYRNED